MVPKQGLGGEEGANPAHSFSFTDSHKYSSDACWLAAFYLQTFIEEKHLQYSTYFIWYVYHVWFGPIKDWKTEIRLYGKKKTKNKYPYSLARSRILNYLANVHPQSNSH